MSYRSGGRASGSRRSAARASAAAVFLIAVAAVAAATPSAAQTVRPVIVEYQGAKVKGKFELANDQLLPLNVILEPKSFDVDENGEPTFRPLDPSIRVKLSEMSFRIPARQSRLVFFEATADSAPAWFTIYATFAGMPRRQGIEIEVELPHTVYMLPKRPLERADVRVSSAVWDSTAHEVRVQLRNAGPSLGRVFEAVASGRKAKREHGSFPLFPGATRRLSIPWDAPEPPARLKITFERFSVEDSLQAG